MEPWEADRSWEAGWLAGFLDGEGSVASNQAARRVTQTVRLAGYQRPGATADRMITAMASRAPTKVFTVQRPESARWSSMVMARVDQLTGIMRLLGTVRPPRLLEKAGTFWEGCALSSKRRRATKALVLGIVNAGRGQIARLSTTTGTYIANGFAVHNTQPVVVVRDPATSKFVIVDGFHRHLIMQLHADIQTRTGGYLPVVVLDKPLNDRMAATIRHNRARGKHSVSGMASMVFAMLEGGWADAEICREIGLTADELLRLKHVTGFSKLFENVEYRRAWESKTQIQLRHQYLADHPEEAHADRG
jgi:hypothetical protein